MHVGTMTTRIIKDVQTSLEMRFRDVQTSLEMRIRDVQTSLEMRIRDVQTSLEMRIKDVKTGGAAVRSGSWSPGEGRPQVDKMPIRGLLP